MTNSRRCRGLGQVIGAVVSGVIALTVTMVPLIVVPAASADGWPVNNLPPDRGTHTYCFGPAFAAEPALTSRAHYSMDNNDGLMAQTVVNTAYYSSCGASTDVRFVETPLANDRYAETACVALNERGYCDQWHLRINYDAVKQYSSNSGYQARKTLCHEIGHTLAVLHYLLATESPDYPAQSCLAMGRYDSGAAWTRRYGGDHRVHINTWFS